MEARSPGSELRRGAALAAAALLLVAWGSSVQAQEAQTRGPSTVAAQAEAARADGRAEEAIALYRKALAAKPAWADGWWRLATLLYDGDAYREAAAAFERHTALNPRNGTAWVMLGLCEYQQGRPDEALAHIQQGKRLGTTPDRQFRRVMSYHEAVLLLGRSEFEQALDVLRDLSADGIDDEELVNALGMAVLRIRPADVRTGDVSMMEMLRHAGLAEHLAARKQFEEAQRRYERLAAEYPAARNVQYALGRHFAATNRPDEAVSAYEREIARFPDHVPARLGIAAIKADTDPAGALPYAESAVTINPRIPLGHYLLGTLLLHTPDTARAIAELEIARRAVPGDPGVHYALGRAYAKAGRAAEAAKARAEFKRLTEQRQAAARRAATPAEEKASTPRP